MNSTATFQPLVIKTLGGLSIFHGGSPAPALVSRKVEALLVYLAYEGRDIPRDSLATLFWHEMPSDRALGNLRTALSDLQTKIPGSLVVTRQAVMINPEFPLWVDAIQLAKTLRGAEENTVSSGELEEALDLYQGDFLSGFRVRDGQNFERWMLQEAEHLRESVIRVLEHMAENALHHQQFPRAIDYGKRILTLDPLAEKAQRIVMKALAYSGQRSLALRQYYAYEQLLRDELDTPPEEETTQLFLAIQSGSLMANIQPSSQMSPPVINVSTPKIVHIPTPATPFIERPEELAQITNRLGNTDCHLLTIVGLGGSGKTRLAMEAASVCAEQFRDGTFFISLAATQSATSIPLQIAQAIELTFQGTDEPSKALLEYLAPRQQLLVLDNFEHLIDGVGLISEILRAAPEVKILVTSREWLNLQGEWVVRISGFPVPKLEATDIFEYGAVQLFAARAARVQPQFSLQEEKSAVVQICQLVEGMPLSIELAASWLRLMPASEIARQISVSFLSGGSRDAPERHRSVKAVFDYSWRLLNEEEATILMRLSVFRGPFNSDSAAQVAGATLAILGSLHEKSLIRRVEPNGYDIHELLRQYALDRFQTKEELAASRDAHLRYYVMFTSDPDSRVHGQKQTQWLDQLEQEHDNLRAALAWSLEAHTESSLQAGLSLGASLWEFWLMRGHISEGRQWLVRLLDATPGVKSLARGNVTQGAGYFTWIQGDSDRAEAIHNEGLTIRRAINDKAGLGGSLSNLGVIAWGRGDFQAARNYYEQALAARREVNYRIGMASVLSNLTLLLKDQGEYKDALLYAEQALDIFTEVDDLQGKALILFNVGAMTYDRGDWEKSIALHQEALALSRVLGDTRMIGVILQSLGQTFIGLEDQVSAQRYLQESLDLITKSGDKMQIGLVKRTQARLALLSSAFMEAHTLIRESLALFTEVKSEDSRGQALMTLGDILRTENAFERAEQAYREAFIVLSKTKAQQALAETIFRLAANAQLRDDAPRAFTLYVVADKLIQRLDIAVPDKFNKLNLATLQQNLSGLAVEEFLAAAQKLELATLEEYISQ